MNSPLEPANGSARSNDESLARKLRLDLEDEERRALVGSYAISMALGLAFLLLQQFGPRVVQEVQGPEEDSPVIWNGPSDPPDPSVIPRRTEGSVRVSVGGGRSGPRDAGTSSRDRISSAFGQPGGSSSGGVIGDPRGMLRDVAVASAEGDLGRGADVKRVLAYGEGGLGSVVPGREGLGSGSGGGSGIGGVQGTGSVGRSAVTVRGPEVVPVGPLPGGGGATALGNFVRGREPELRFCYEESLRRNPGLAGSVTVAITLSATGSITAADVTRRTWSGTGAAEAESCMVRMIRAWRPSDLDRAAGTYSFPFSFTR